MAEDFDDILDQCVYNIQRGRDIVESSLAQYPRYADRLRPMLEIVARVRPAALPPLRPEQRALTKARLLERADQLAAQRRRVVTRRPMAGPIWLRLMPVALALMMICSFAGWGVATASAYSLPGDILYPIKRVSEQVTMAVADTANRPNLHVQFAQRRLDEFEALSVRGDFSQGLVTEASNEIAEALGEVAQSNEPGQRMTLQSILQMTDARQQTWSMIAASAPATERASLQSALDVLTARRQQAASLLTTNFPPAGGSDATAVVTATPSAQATPESGPTAIAAPGSHEPRVTPPGQARTPKPEVEPHGQVKPKTTPPGRDKSPPDRSPPGRSK